MIDLFLNFARSIGAMLMQILPVELPPLELGLSTLATLLVVFHCMWWTQRCTESH